MKVNECDEFGDGWRAVVECVGREPTPAGDAIELRKLLMKIRRPVKLPSPKGSKKSSSQGSVEEEEDVDEYSEDGIDTDSSSAASAGDEATHASRRAPLRQRPMSMVMNPLERRRNGSPEWWKTPTPPGFVDEEKVVWHFLYKKWPDFGVPAFEDLDSFFQLMRLSRERSMSYQAADADGRSNHSASQGSFSSDGSNPRIVHCSAGVGRSGTFIALEHLIRELDEGAFASERYYGRQDSQHANGNGNGHDRDHDRDANGGSPASSAADSGSPSIAPDAEAFDPVFETVNRLREQRRNMVQAESQFLFIYQVLRKLWQDKYGAAEADYDAAAERGAKRLEVEVPDGTGTASSTNDDWSV